MKDKLTTDEVLKVAKLARIEVADIDMEKYQVELKQLLTSIDKIKEVETTTDELLITPVSHQGEMSEDQPIDMITFTNVKSNIPHTKGNFVEVPVMINE